MPRPPYIGFPFPYYKNIPKSPQNFAVSNYVKNTDTKLHYNDNFLKSDSNSESEVENLRFNKQKEKKNKSNNNNDYLFDLFGLKLYTDDVLLVSLIYFLYSEGVKDESLFIVLILLLLS